MQLYLLALNPTDSVTGASCPPPRLGFDVTLLTDRPTSTPVRGGTTGTAPRRGARLRSAGLPRGDRPDLARHRPPDAVFTNSDHLQTQAALAADYFGLPGKDWRAALRTKDKAEMRRQPRRHRRRHRLVPPRSPPARTTRRARRGLDVPYPCVVKPREGVASEDVVLVDDADGTAPRAPRRSARGGPAPRWSSRSTCPASCTPWRPLGDGRHAARPRRLPHRARRPPPYFIEERLDFVPPAPEPVRRARCWPSSTRSASGSAPATPSSSSHEGRARIIEVNYRAIGDQCDLLLARAAGHPALRAHPPHPPGRAAARRTSARATDGAARVEYPVRRPRRAPSPPRPPRPTGHDGDVRLTYRPLRARRVSATSCTAPTATTSACCGPSAPTSARSTGPRPSSSRPSAGRSPRDRRPDTARPGQGPRYRRRTSRPRPSCSRACSARCCGRTSSVCAPAARSLDRPDGPWLRLPTGDGRTPCCCRCARGRLPERVRRAAPLLRRESDGAELTTSTACSPRSRALADPGRTATGFDAFAEECRQTLRPCGCTPVPGTRPSPG